MSIDLLNFNTQARMQGKISKQRDKYGGKRSRVSPSQKDYLSLARLLTLSSISSRLATSLAMSFWTLYMSLVPSSLITG